MLLLSMKVSNLHGVSFKVLDRTLLLSRLHVGRGELLPTIPRRHELATICLIAEWSILQSTAYHQPIWALHSQFLSGSFSKREFIFFSNPLENALGLGQPVNADTS